MGPARLNKLISQIKYNCNVSDAVFGGNLSLCNMLLRLRQLYYNEHSLEPWQNTDNKVIIDWIGEREKLWNNLEEVDLKSLAIEKNTFDPFHTRQVNQLLESSGLVYGAGYGMFGKPQFFLAKSLKTERRGKINISYLGKEHCTDLLPSLALSRDNTVLVRKRILINYIFHKFRDRKSGSLSENAFSMYGVNQRSLKKNYPELFSKIADDLFELIVLHEIAEIKHRSQPLTKLLSSGVPKNIELFFRAIKDCIADLSNMGPLDAIIKDRRKDLLLLYAAFLSEWYNIFFPAMPLVFKKFQNNMDFKALENFRKINLIKVKNYYNELAVIYQTDGIAKINRLVIDLQKNPFNLLSDF
jgi:hypothetical protein